ncbi:MAG: DNA gyrase inhibitor YacG [Acidobacteriota bacterium]
MKRRRQLTCPTCGKVVRPDNPAFPFCSERCRLLDLGRWVDGSFRIPGEKVAETEGEGEQH